MPIASEHSSNSSASVSSPLDALPGAIVLPALFFASHLIAWPRQICSGDRSPYFPHLFYYRRLPWRSAVYP